MTAIKNTGIINFHSFFVKFCFCLLVNSGYEEAQRYSLSLFLDMDSCLVSIVIALLAIN